MTVEFVIRGKVQGVGYRYFVRSAAKDLGLTGWVMNRQDGNVLLQATGSASAIAALKEKCLAGPRAAVVEGLDEQVLPEEKCEGFQIRR